MDVSNAELSLYTLDHWLDVLLSLLFYLFVSFGQRTNGHHSCGRHNEEEVAGEKVNRQEGGVHGERRSKQVRVQGVRNQRREEDGVDIEERRERQMPSGLQEEGEQEPIATGMPVLSVCVHMHMCVCLAGGNV